MTSTISEGGILPAQPRIHERLLAALAHLLTCFSLPGTALAMLIWLACRHRSRWVARQAREAVLWQLLGHTLLLGFLGLLLGIAFVSFGDALTPASAHSSTAVRWLLSSLCGVDVLLFLALTFAGTAIVAAVLALFGHTYHYPRLRMKRTAPDARPTTAQVGDASRGDG